MKRYIGYMLLIFGLGAIVVAIFEIYRSNAQINQQKEIIEQKLEQQVNVQQQLLIGEGDGIGLLYIPKLNRELPIIEGTDEQYLDEGVGHYLSSGLPGDNRQIVLSGHRNTVFKGFSKLEIGDEFHLKTVDGTFPYKIEKTKIVDAESEDVIKNVDYEELVVSTCYPFSYIGDAPKRFIFYAYPIK